MGGTITMLPKKWETLERQRPMLRWVKWGGILGALLTVGGVVGFGNIPLGLLLLVGSGVWGYRILNR